MGTARNQKCFQKTKTTFSRKQQARSWICHLPTSSKSTSSYKNAMQTPYYEMRKRSCHGMEKHYNSYVKREN